MGHQGTCSRVNDQLAPSIDPQRVKSPTDAAELGAVARGSWRFVLLFLGDWPYLVETGPSPPSPLVLLSWIITDGSHWSFVFALSLAT